jgi:antibiotic biosynthesis monooxygenase (ABM) superfamily enzyme
MSYKNILSIVLFVSIVAFFAGCQNKEQSVKEDHNLIIETPELGGPPPISPGEMDRTTAPKTGLTEKFQEVNYKQQAQNNTFNTQDKRMIIRTGTMSIEADSYNETEAKIKEIVKNFGGYMTNSTSKLNADGKKQGSITIRVVSEKFDAMVSELSKVGKVMNQNVTGNDVTEEYMDADARLKTQRELESRLLKLLEEKTAKLTDVVDVEQKLANVRENIERTEGRMKYLKDQASYSTLTVSVYEPSLLVTSTGGGFFYELGQGVKKGLSGFTSVLRGMITVIIALSPIIIIVLIIAYFTVKYFKKKKLARTEV